MERRARREFPEWFKREAVDRVAANALARELGVHTVRAAMDDAVLGAGDRGGEATHHTSAPVAIYHSDRGVQYAPARRDFS